MLFANTINGILQGIASFVANLTLLYLLNRFVNSIIAEANARKMSDEEAMRIVSEADLYDSRRLNISQAVEAYLRNDEGTEEQTPKRLSSQTRSQRVNSVIDNAIWQNFIIE